MSAALRYRDEPVESAAMPAGGREWFGRLGNPDAMPPGYRLDGVRFASGVWFDVAGPDGALSIQLVPARPETARLLEVEGVHLRVAGDPRGVPGAARILASVVKGLRELCAEDGGERLRGLVRASEGRHEYPAAKQPAVRGNGGSAELRLLLACNQRCFFCNCDENAPNLVRSFEEARTAMERLRARGVRELTLTGGEPSLRPDLPELVRLARELGFSPISMQTNAVLLGEEGLAARLRGAGLERAFVSLHGRAPETVDRQTGMPGGFERTVRGIDARLDAGVAVTANFVATRGNLPELPGFHRFVLERFSGRVGDVMLSFMSPVAAALKNLEEMPRLGEAGAAFRAELLEGARSGMRIRAAGVCGLPLCQLRGCEAQADESQNPVGVRVPEDRRLGAACSGCGFRGRCTGFWKAYLDRYGEGELVPLPEGAWA